MLALSCGASVFACSGAQDHASPPSGALGTSGPDLLAITTPPDASSTVLGWYDADTLAPKPGGVDLGEYHDAWAFSADGRTLAVGTFGRTGVRLIDVRELSGLRITRDVPMPVATVGVAWLRPERIAVLLQRDGVAIVDAAAGRIERRWPLSYRFPCERRRQAVTPYGVVFVVATRVGAIRLVIVDADGGLRFVSLPRVRAPSTVHTCGSAAFAVDPAGGRAVVVGSRGPIAEVDLASLAVRYNDDAKLRSALGQVPGCRPVGATCTMRRTAEWSATRRLVMAGVNVVDRRGARPFETPTGVSVVDPTTWSARRVDRSAGAVTVTRDGTLLTFGGRRAGVRATARDRSVRWTALTAERVRSVSATGNRVYVLDETGATTHVLDAATGARISSPSPGLGRLDILTGRAHSGDPGASVER